VIVGTATAKGSEGWSDTLYRAPDVNEVAGRAQRVVAIPYYANANRGPVQMAVWMPIET